MKKTVPMFHFSHEPQRRVPDSRDYIAHMIRCARRLDQYTLQRLELGVYHITVAGSGLVGVIETRVSQ